MLTGIAWRNIWRSRTRSLIILCAIATGLCSGLISSSISFGMGEQMIQSAILTRLSHIQIHNPEFTSERDIDFYIPDAKKLGKQIMQAFKISSISERIVINAMASSATSATGVLILGVDPSQDATVSAIDESIIKGEYFNGETRYPVVIGEKLANTLKIENGSKIVLTFQNKSGDITGGAFRVVGIFKTVSSKFDKSNVFVLAGDLWEILETDTIYTEIAVLLNRGTNVDTAAFMIRKIAPQMKIDTWRTLAPELSYIEETTSISLFIFMGVILVALTFGITNSMLMAVMERKREIGMLMAVGMSGKSIFLMILMETVFLSFTGAFIGIILTVIIIAILSRTGIDLTYFSQGLSEFGIGEILIPYLPGYMYAVVTLMVLVTAIIASMYPAIKAIRFRPAEVLRM